MPLKRKIAKFIEYVFVRFFIGLLGLIPFNARRILAEKFILLISRVLKKNTQIIQNNIRLAFPDKDDAWVENIFRKNLERLGKFVAEFMEIKKMRNPKIRDRIVFSPSKEDTVEHFKDGALMILGHMGNWEMQGALYAQWLPEDKLYVIASRQTNPWSNAYINGIRNGIGIKIVFNDGNAMRYLKLLREKKVLCFLADQNAGRNGNFFQFLNRPASTHMGPAIFARVSGAKVFFAYSTHEGGRIHTYIEPLALPKIDPKKHPDEWEIELTKSWVARLEEIVKKHPEDYFWAHNRWKTRPQPNDKIYS